MSEKPRHRDGYTAEEAALVRAMCLTVAVTLGDFLDDVVIVGGLVPSLLIDTEVSETERAYEPHPGTNDLDLGLKLAVFDEARYADISARLRAEDFGPDKNPNGNVTVQRWQRDGLKLDFLMPPLTDEDQEPRVKHLQADFGALIVPGLPLAFDENEAIGINGTTLTGEQANRTVRVCGPGAFVVLKALAFHNRGEPKDAYDLVYVLRGSAGRPNLIAERIRRHLANHPTVVGEAIEHLKNDFASPTMIGPMRAAQFETRGPEDLEDAAADAHGFVDDLLNAISKSAMLNEP